MNETIKKYDHIADEIVAPIDVSDLPREKQSDARRAAEQNKHDLKEKMYRGLIIDGLLSGPAQVEINSIIQRAKIRQRLGPKS